MVGGVVITTVINVIILIILKILLWQLLRLGVIFGYSTIVVSRAMIRCYFRSVATILLLVASNITSVTLVSSIVSS